MTINRSEFKQFKYLVICYYEYILTSIYIYIYIYIRIPGDRPDKDLNGTLWSFEI